MKGNGLSLAVRVGGKDNLVGLFRLGVQRGDQAPFALGDVPIASEPLLNDDAKAAFAASRKVANIAFAGHDFIVFPKEIGDDF